MNHKMVVLKIEEGRRNVDVPSKISSFKKASNILPKKNTWIKDFPKQLQPAAHNAEIIL